MTDQTWNRVQTIARVVIWAGVVLVVALLVFGPIFGGPDEPRPTPPAPPCRGDSLGFCPTPLPFLIAPPWVTP